MIFFFDVMKLVERKICFVDNFVIRIVNSGVLILIFFVCVGFILLVFVGDVDVDVIRVLDVCVVIIVFFKVKDFEVLIFIVFVGSDVVDKFVVCVIVIVDDVILFVFRVVIFIVLGGFMEEVELQFCIELLLGVCEELVDIEEFVGDDDVMFDKDIVGIVVVMFI